MFRINARWAVVLVCFLFGGGVELQAKDAPTVYIGIEKNRKPYVYIDEKQQEQGILVEAIKSYCLALGLNCKFVGGSFNDLLRSLRFIKLNAVVVVDQALPPDVDKLGLTHPPSLLQFKLTDQLCHIKPVFIQKKSAFNDGKADVLKKTKFGAQEGSIFHQYLVDHYTGQAELKSYPLVETAIVDLLFDRVDIVMADEAFINSRVLNTALDEYFQLVVTKVDQPDWSVNSMALVMRETDRELLKQLSNALQTSRAIPTCAELLNSKSAISGRD